jgi:hypothetical protein
VALKPKDLTLSPEEIEEANKLEEMLDSGLREYCLPEKGKEIKLVTGQCSPRVSEEVIRRYTKEPDGWTSVRYNCGFMIFMY